MKAGSKRSLQSLIAVLLAAFMIIMLCCQNIYADTVSCTVYLYNESADGGSSTSLGVDVTVNGESVYSNTSFRNFKNIGTYQTGDEIRIKPVLYNTDDYSMLGVQYIQYNGYLRTKYNFDGPDEDGWYSYTMTDTESDGGGISIYYTGFLDVSVAEGIENGSVTLDSGGVATDYTAPDQPTRVSVIPVPDEGYYTSSVMYSTDGGTNWTEITKSDDGSYSFAPGRYSAVVKAVFEEGNEPEEEPDEPEEDIPEEVTVSSETELRELASAVNEGKWNGYDGVAVKLSADIELTDEWTPIGTFSSPFRGDFEGQGHTISGLRINDDYSSDTHVVVCYGLFGAVKAGSVKNVSVSGNMNVKFEKKNSSTLIEVYTGGITGYAGGCEITGCTSDVDISIKKDAESTYETVDIGNDSCAFTVTGGIAGYVSSEYISSSESISSEIEDCVNKGKLSVFFTGINECVGGIAGQFYFTGDVKGTISRCANFGKISTDLPCFYNGNTGDQTYGNYVDFQYGNVGGIVGDGENVIISSSCNKGNFSGKSGCSLGGIAGNSINNNKTIELVDCYNMGNLTIDSKPAQTTSTGVGGLIGAHCSKGGTGAVSGGTAPNNGIYSAVNCYNAGNIVITETDALYTSNIYMDPLLLLDNGTSSNNYTELIGADALGSAYKEDGNLIQEGWPLLVWENEEESSEEYEVSFTTSTEAEVSLYYDKEETRPVEKSGSSYSLTNGTYYYRACADGYVDETGSVKVNNEDLVTNIVLYKAVKVNLSAVPENADIKVTDAYGDTVPEGKSGTFTLKKGRSYTYTAAEDGFISYSEDFNASDGLELSTSLLSREGITEVTGEEFHITEKGTYHVTPDYSGMIYLDTSEKVTIAGDGIADSVKCSDVFIDATVGGIDLTLENIFISDNDNTANVVDVDETNNIISIEGKVVLDYDVGYTDLNDALIHVAEGESLTVKGSGIYYQYNCTQGAGIGGNTGEMNGDITFAMTGSAFIKGTKQGAVIGAGASSTGSTPGKITFESGTYNLISNSRGAVIGGSAGSNGASEGTEVYFNGGNININVDFSGAAVGGGGYSKGNDASGGTAYFGGASVRVYVDKNAAANLSEGWNGQTITEGINDAAITAKRLNSEGEKVYRCTFDTSLADGAESDETYTVYLDGSSEAFYNGGLHEWGYVQEKLDKETGEQINIDSTISNWYPISDPCLYFYLTGEDHELMVNGKNYEAVWDSETETFTIREAGYDGLSGDVNFNNKVNIIDAQIVYDMANGSYQDRENYQIMQLAADVNADGNVDALDARAIQFYVHTGAFN